MGAARVAADEGRRTRARQGCSVGCTGCFRACWVCALGGAGEACARRRGCEKVLWCAQRTDGGCAPVLRASAHGRGTVHTLKSARHDGDAAGRGATRGMSVQHTRAHPVQYTRGLGGPAAQASNQCIGIMAASSLPAPVSSPSWGPHGPIAPFTRQWRLSWREGCCPPWPAHGRAFIFTVSQRIQHIEQPAQLD